MLYTVSWGNLIKYVIGRSNKVDNQQISIFEHGDYTIIHPKSFIL